MIQRFDVINYLIKSGAIKSDKYLELGSQNGETLSKVKAKRKVSVDPHPGGVGPSVHANDFHEVRTDTFFQENSEKFDIVFVDGDHKYGQCKRDLNNALKVLNKGGAVVLHDANPPSKQYSEKEWCGEVYKVITEYRLENPNTFVFTVEEDFGVCVIIPSINDRANPSIQSNTRWDYFERNKEEILCLVSFEQFKEVIKTAFDGKEVELKEGSDVPFEEEELIAKTSESDEPTEEESHEDTDSVIVDGYSLPKDEKKLKEMYEDFFGKKPHHKKSIETIQKDIIEKYENEESNKE